MKQTRQMRCYCAKKNILNKLIPRKSLSTLCAPSLLTSIDNKNGPHRVSRSGLSKWIDNVSC